jgi:hypothetical protein
MRERTAADEAPTTTVGPFVLAAEYVAAGLAVQTERPFSL